jgi:predicted nucleic acid-binding protein
VRKAEAIMGGTEARFIAAPVVFEVSSGLLYRRARRQAAEFRNIAARFSPLAFDAAAARRAAEIRAEFKAIGRPKAPVDAMIAGTALAGGHALVTRDRNFDAIADAFGLRIDSY